MPTCIYSKVEFERADGEHILQNFLGARWTSPLIVSNEVQKEFGRTIDVSLEEGLRPIRNLFGTRGGRGEEGPTLKKLPTPSGRLIDLTPGGKPRISEPVVRIEKTGEVETVNMELGIISQLEWALAKLREERPGLAIDAGAAKAAARPVSAPLGEPVKLELKIGGVEYFRGALKACFNLLGVNNPALALSPCCDPVRTFITTGQGDIENFVRWIPKGFVPHWKSIGAADHFIGLTAARGGIEGIIQFFGEIRHSIRLAESYDGPPFKYSYIVNPFRDTEPAEERNPIFEEAHIPIFKDQLVLPCEEIWSGFREGISKLCSLYFDLSRQEFLQRLITEEIGPLDDRPITQEIMNRLARRVAEELTKGQTPPSV